MAFPKFLIDYEIAILCCPSSHNHIVNNKLEVMMPSKPAIFIPKKVISSAQSDKEVSVVGRLMKKSPIPNGNREGNANVKKLCVVNSDKVSLPRVGQGPYLLTFTGP